MLSSLNRCLLVAAAFIVFIGTIPDVHAKRFGGGRSFGSRPSYSSPFRRSVRPNNSATQQRAQARNQQLRNGFSRRGGLMGMLGGLALGGLLGSLLFGGAFENINFFDILVFGLIAWLLYKLFSARARPQPQYRSSASDYAATEGIDSPHNLHTDNSDRPRSFETDLLFKKGSKNSHNRSHIESEDADFGSPVLPSDFASDSFLIGAKNAYRTLQEAWDRGDLSGIRGLTTDAIFTEINDQIGQRESNDTTDVLKLDAELLDFRESGGQHEVTVLFDAVLREEADMRPAQVREIWHFIRPVHSRQNTWLLDGIQQLED